LFSITTAAPDLLVAWTVGQTVEMAYAGGFVGWALTMETHRGVFTADIAASLGWVILTVLLQSFGVVPSGVPG